MLCPRVADRCYGVKRIQFKKGLWKCLGDGGIGLVLARLPTPPQYIFAADIDQRNLEASEKQFSSEQFPL
ncbi:hypothetical protein TNCV_2131391 [Trichonephila clavipes]|nr:hypothetical protein TNCV_2131391 [Trichonephila clavipes]